MSNQPSFGLCKMPQERRLFEGKLLKPKMTSEDLETFKRHLGDITQTIKATHKPGSIPSENTTSARTPYVPLPKSPPDSTNIRDGLVWRKCTRCGNNFQESAGGQIIIGTWMKKTVEVEADGLTWMKEIRFPSKRKLLGCGVCYDEYLSKHGRMLDK